MEIVPSHHVAYKERVHAEFGARTSEDIQFAIDETQAALDDLPDWAFNSNSAVYFGLKVQVLTAILDSRKPKR